MPRTVWIILLLEALVHLLAQPVHEHVHDVRPRVEAVVPHVRQDHRLRDDAAGVAHQVLEQRELARPERLERTPPRDARRGEQVQREVAHRQRVGAGAACERRMRAWTRASSSANANGLVR